MSGDSYPRSLIVINVPKLHTIRATVQRPADRGRHLPGGALRRDYEALTQLGERYLLSTVAGELARVLYAQGRLDEAEKCSRHAQELADPDDIASTTLWRTVQAKLLAQKGNRDAALILIGEAVDLLKRTDSVVAQAETLVDLAEVLRLAGRRKEADDVLEGAVELFEAKGNVAAVEALRVPAASS